MADRIPDVNADKPQHYEGCSFTATGKCSCDGPMEWIQARSKPAHGCWDSGKGPCDECRADGWVPIGEALPGGRYDGILEENGLELRRERE